MTIGYKEASDEDFLSMLLTAGTSPLLDFREIASCRGSGFAKTASRSRLERVDIAYRHEPQLGSPRDIRKRFRESGDYATFFREFDVYRATQDTLVAHLAEALAGSVVLLCSERGLLRVPS